MASCSEGRKEQKNRLRRAGPSTSAGITVLDHLAGPPHSPIGFPSTRTPRHVRHFAEAHHFATCIRHPCVPRFSPLHYLALNRTDFEKAIHRSHRGVLKSAANDLWIKMFKLQVATLATVAYFTFPRPVTFSQLVSRTLQIPRF